MRMEFEELKKITKKEKSKEMRVFEWFEFIFWWIISQIVFLFPFILIAIGLIWMFK
jgi:hypothetical protein